MTRMAVPLCLVGLVLAAIAMGSTSATTKTFRDTTGEDPAGPDITTVTASSNGYVLTFWVAIPTNPTVTPDFRLRVWLDADDSLQTGLTLEEGPTGLDHFLLVDPTRFHPDEAVLYVCEGTVCSGGAGSSSLDFSYASGATFTTDAPSLGLRRIDRLRFSVTATTGIAFDPASGYDFANAHLDLAPDLPEDGAQPMWTFAARPLRVNAFRATPQRPRAGRSFALTLRVVDNEVDLPLARGTVACLLRVRGKRIPARSQSMSHGLAKCVFAVPERSRGARFEATIRVTAKGATVARSLTGEIR